MILPASRLALLGAAIALHVGVAHSHDVALEGPIEVPDGSDAYVTANGEAVRTGSGHCLRLGGFSEGEQVDACEGIEETLVEAEPEPAAAPAPPPEPVATVTLQEVDERALFEFDSSELTLQGQAEMAELLVELERYDNVTDVAVIGYTDAIGTEEYNQDLSERRAAAVGALLAVAYPEALILMEGRGEQNPIATNDTPQGRQMNRRVDIEVIAAETTFE